MAIKNLQQHLNFDFANKQNFASKKIWFSSFFSPSSCLPSSTHFFCYVPFSPHSSSYTHFFFYFFSLFLLPLPIIFPCSLLPSSLFSIHGFFALDVLLFGSIVVCFFPMSLTTLYAMLQTLLFFVFFFSMFVTNYNVLFQCNFIL